jgi:hypothetical protein
MTLKPIKILLFLDILIQAGIMILITFWLGFYSQIVLLVGLTGLAAWQVISILIFVIIYSFNSTSFPSIFKLRFRHFLFAVAYVVLIIVGVFSYEFNALALFPFMLYFNAALILFYLGLTIYNFVSI